MAGSVTVRDVAREAKVSAATVSRALSSPDLVAAHTRTRILEAAELLGYNATPLVRGAQAKRTGNFGLVVPDLENPYFASVTKGVQARALTQGYAVFVADSDEDARTELDLVRRLAAQVDGLILCSPRMSDADLAAAAQETPSVVVNRNLEGLTSISADDGDVVRQALEHLYALGHRHVGYVGGPTGSYSDKQRRNGIESVVPNLPGLKVTSIGAFAPVFGGGRSAADLVVASGVSAVLAYNDLVALGIISRLGNRGIEVPRDMSVVGIDGIEAGMLVNPALTTVRAPLRRFGRTAVDLLIDKLSPNAGPDHSEYLPVDLVVRQSTAVPPSSVFNDRPAPMQDDTEG